MYHVSRFDDVNTEEYPTFMQSERMAEPSVLSTGVSVTSRFFSGLADPTRLAIVELLLERPRAVGEIVAALGLRQNRVSNALACLKWCGYVEGRRDGRQVWYSITDPRVRTLVGLAHTIVADHAAALASCTRLPEMEAEGMESRTASQVG
jgi:DNA-binding transcriptional ArsR family regulator